MLRGETTLGGATVLDPAPPRRLDEERLELLEQGDPASIVSATVDAPVSVEALRRPWPALAPAELEEGLAAVVQAGGWAFSREWLEETRESVVDRLRARAESDRRSSRGSRSPSCFAASHGRRPSCRCCRSSGAAGWPTCPGVAASLGARAAAAEELGRELEAAGLAAVKVDDAELARYLEGDGRLVRLGDGFAVSSAAYERARELVVAECRAAGEITLARFRDLAGVGRRDAQLLLERLDQDGVTRRIGDRRVLRRAGRTT